jgi:hypothetical protein
LAQEVHRIKSPKLNMFWALISWQFC